ncbi:MAG: hypothetical protein GXP22_02905 [Gammaproteobacteria bacterium]|nr:hypothetical protein [Gammaproteobacteria bacterium]
MRLRTILLFIPLIFIAIMLPTVSVGSTQEYSLAVSIALYLQPWVISCFE